MAHALEITSNNSTCTAELRVTASAHADSSGLPDPRHGGSVTPKTKPSVLFVIPVIA